MICFLFQEDTDSFSEPLTNGDILPNCTAEINSTTVAGTEKDEIQLTPSTPQSITANNVDTTSPDMPTDVGDTSEDDEGEVGPLRQLNITQPLV